MLNVPSASFEAPARTAQVSIPMALTDGDCPMESADVIPMTTAAEAAGDDIPRKVTVSEEPEKEPESVKG